MTTPDVTGQQRRDGTNHKSRNNTREGMVGKETFIEAESQLRHREKVERVAVGTQGLHVTPTG